jgi:hypothetical protein
VTKSLPKPNVQVAVKRTGLPRLTSAERKQLASVEDPVLKQVLGEMFIASRANQDNFDEITQWFPIQPADVAYAVKDQIVFRFTLREGFLEEFDNEQGVIEFLDEAGVPNPNMEHIEKVRFSLLDLEERTAGLLLDYISEIGAGTHRGIVMMAGQESGAFLAFELTGEAEGGFGTVHREAPVVPIVAGNPSPDFIYGEQIALFSIGAVQGEKGEKGDEGDKGDQGAPGQSGIACRVATTAALPANTRTGNTLEANANGALPNVDQTALAVDDVVLVKDEATGANRGPYKVESLGSAGSKWKLTRAAQMDSSEECLPGMLFTVAEGQVGQDSIYMLTTNGPIVLNATALTFTWAAVKLPVVSQITWYNGTAEAAHVFANEFYAELKSRTSEKFASFVAEGGSAIPWVGVQIDPGTGMVTRRIWDAAGKSEFLQLSGNRKERDFGLVAALPSEPVEGDRCFFEVNADVTWEFVYDGEGEYPWRCVGPTPLVDRVPGIGSRNNAAYGDCTGGTTTVPKVKAPLKGKYLVDHGVGGAQLTGGASSNAYISIEVEATAASDEDACVAISIQNFEGSGVAAEAIKKTLKANGEVKQKYKGHTNTLQWDYRNRWVRLTPLRVG